MAPDSSLAGRVKRWFPPIPLLFRLAFIALLDRHVVVARYGELIFHAQESGDIVARFEPEDSHGLLGAMCALDGQIHVLLEKAVVIVTPPPGR